MSTTNPSTSSSSHDSLPEIDPAEIEFEEKIGEGSYGQVFSGKCRGKQVAIKVFKPDMFQSEEEREAIRAEVRIMSKIFHPNVVLFMGACTLEGNNVMIVSEKMPTDLETLLIHEKKQISPYIRMKMAYDCALGMNWLHSSNPIFIHRDLKLSNLLVDNSYRVCVCDFGLAQTKPRDVKTLGYDPHGSPLYMAPEVFVGDYNEKCDIYSFGIVFWEIYTQSQAYADISDNLAKFIHLVCEENFRPPLPDDAPSSVTKLIEDCWAKSPSKRPTFKEIIKRLEVIIVDVAVDDTRGRKLWKDHFVGKEEVSWDEFRMGFCDTLQLPDPDKDDIQFKCLEAVITEKPKNIIGHDMVVTLERFGNVCAWFGPLDSHFLGRIESLLAEKFFHGFITTQEAEERLNDQEKGTYLVRFSTSAPGCFTISHINNKKKLLHQRVVYHPGKGFAFWDNTYEDMKSLIKAERKNQFFVQPCPGSRYQKLFKKKDSKSSKSAPVEELGYAAANPSRK